MKKLNIYALSLAVAALGGAGSASAQTTGPVGVSLRAGVFFPTDSGVSSAFGSTWFAFGAEYKLANVGGTPEYSPAISLSLDYYSRNAINATPILLNYVVHKDSLFGSVGLGISFDHSPGDSSARLGYQVGVGYDLPVSSIPVFLEAKFFGSDNSAYNGFGIYAGVRF